MDPLATAGYVKSTAEGGLSWECEHYKHLARQLIGE